MKRVATFVITFQRDSFFDGKTFMRFIKNLSAGHFGVKTGRNQILQSFFYAWLERGGVGMSGRDGVSPDEKPSEIKSLKTRNKPYLVR